MIVTDKKTGRKYNPEIEFKNLMNKDWVIKILKRLKMR